MSDYRGGAAAAVPAAAKSCACNGLGEPPSEAAAACALSGAEKREGYLLPQT